MNRIFDQSLLIWVHLKKKVKRILSIFNAKNCLGCERASEKEAFKQLREAGLIIMRRVVLSTSYNSH